MTVAVSCWTSVWCMQCCVPRQSVCSHLPRLRYYLDHADREVYVIDSMLFERTRLNYTFCLFSKLSKRDFIISCCPMLDSCFGFELCLVCLGPDHMKGCDSLWGREGFGVLFIPQCHCQGPHHNCPGQCDACSLGLQSCTSLATWTVNVFMTPSVL